MSVCVCVCMCLYVCVYVCLCTSCTCVFTIGVCLCVSVYFCLSVCLCTYLYRCVHCRCIPGDKYTCTLQVQSFHSQRSYHMASWSSSSRHITHTVLSCLHTCWLLHTDTHSHQINCQCQLFITSIISNRSADIISGRFTRDILITIQYNLQCFQIAKYLLVFHC